jgi:hypothetical protein
VVTKGADREAEKEEAPGSLETHLTRRLHRSRKLRGTVMRGVGRLHPMRGEENYNIYDCLY